MIAFRTLYLDDTAVTGRVIDLFDAEAPTRDTALFFVHGGGWTGGSRTIFHSIILAYRAHGFDCASTDYRLGINVFEQIADVQDGLQAFSEDLGNRGRKANIALIGSSAGAHLAMMAALLPPIAKPTYRMIAMCVQAAPFTFEPWPDIFPAIWTAMKNAIGAPYKERPELYRKASPVEHITTDTPPIFSLYAENEHMFPLELTERFSDKAHQHGIVFQHKVYPRTEHGFFYSLDRWQQKEAFQDILRFIEDGVRTE